MTSLDNFLDQGYLFYRSIYIKGIGTKNACTKGAGIRTAGIKNTCIRNDLTCASGACIWARGANIGDTHIRYTSGINIIK